MRRPWALPDSLRLVCSLLTRANRSAHLICRKHESFRAGAGYLGADTLHWERLMEYRRSKRPCMNKRHSYCNICSACYTSKMDVPVVKGFAPGCAALTGLYILLTVHMP